jgi:uncharacterized protein (DUF58 family)
MEEDKEMTTYVRRFERSSLILSLIPVLTTLFTLIAIYIGFNNFWYYVFLGITLLITILAFPIRKLRADSLEILKMREEEAEE